MKKIFIFCALFGCLAWGNSLSQIKSDGVIRIGTAPDVPPFSKLVDGKFEGFEISFARELANNLFKNKKGRVEFVSIPSSKRVSVLQDNKVDLVISTFSVTPERKKYIDFSTPYFSTDTAILTRKKDGVINMDSLKNKKIIVQEGTVAYDKLKKVGGYELVLCESEGDCYRKLKNNEGDGVINDNTILLAYTIMDSDVELGVKTYGRSDMIAIGVQKGNKELLNFVNSQVLKLSSQGFFKKAFNDELNPFYKGKADKKYFLLDDFYNILQSF